VVLRTSRQRRNLHGSAGLLLDLVISLFHNEEWRIQFLNSTAFFTSLHGRLLILYFIANVLHGTKDFLACLVVLFLLEVISGSLWAFIPSTRSS